MPEVQLTRLSATLAAAFLVQTAQRRFLLTAALLLPCVAQAQQVPAAAGDPSVSPKPSQFTTVTQQGVTEDWGLRARLAEDGVKLNAVIMGQGAANTRGYHGRGTAYAQEIDFGATLDLAKLGISSGTVRILFSDRVGRTIQDRTGAYFSDQHAYGQGQNFRFDELSYERHLGTTVSLKSGFYAMGNDFGTLSYTCDFNNGANCGHPASLPDNSGWQDPPTGQWGARIKVYATRDLYFQLGVYDVTPKRTLPRNGFNLGFPGTTGVVAPFEVGYVTGRTARAYPGTFKFGIYYDSSRVPDVAIPARHDTGRGGIYLQAAKQVWKVRPGAVQGLAVFAIATLNEADTALFRRLYEAGLSFRGPFNRRDDDIISLGWSRADVNDRLVGAERNAGAPQQSREELIEFNYGAQVRPWLLVRPSVQYVVHPGALASRPDSAVFTLHVQATL